MLMLVLMLMLLVLVLKLLVLVLLMLVVVTTVLCGFCSRRPCIAVAAADVRRVGRWTCLAATPAAAAAR